MNTSENNAYKNYKALPVEETIMNLRSRLHSSGIMTYEKHWWEVEDKNLTSVQIVLDDNDKVRTAGKGINKRYALASGLAEMMERLQNLQFTQNVNSCEKRIDHHYRDSKIMDYDEIKTIHYFLPRHKNNIRILSEKKKDIVTVPFYNVFKDSVEYFPFDTLWCCTGSNGMCAGNTPAESLIQGICEIFERHVLYKMYFEGLTLPTVPEEFLKNTRHWLHISALKEKGYTVKVKDCSLGGEVPVVGILVSKDNKATFCAGSAPDFNIALERCFTENMQGRNLDILYNMMPEVKSLESKDEIALQYRLSLTKHTGSLTENAFVDAQKAEKKHLFWNANATSKKTLLHLINIIKNMGYDLFIRDVSFLGFPTHHVYVPGMSDIVPDYNSALFADRMNFNLKKIFFNSDQATKDDLSALAETLDKKLRHSKEHNLPFKLLSLFGLAYRESTSLNMISPEIFLIVLYCKLKNYDKALENLSTFLKSFSPTDEKARHAFTCFKEMVTLLKKGETTVSIMKTLSSKYSSDILQENVKLIDSDYPLSRVFDIPNPSRCSTCKVCYFKELHQLTNKLSERMAEYKFDQAQLKNVLT